MKTNNYFIGPASAFIVACGFFLLFTEPREAQLAFHQWSASGTGLLIFQWITMWAEWPFFVLAGALFLYYRNFRGVLAILFAAGASAATSQFLKRVVFPDAERPMAFFGTESIAFPVDEFTVLLEHSFPSGHSTAAFALMGTLAFFIRRRAVSIALAVVAMLTAFSRVYLMLHWVVDIAAGAALGLLVAIAVNAVVITRTKKAAP